MSEFINNQEKSSKRPLVAPPMAMRAIALCEGCPMAKFCSVKGSGDCPPPEVLEVASGGDFDAAETTSYKNQLLDNSQNVVMANLKRKPAPVPEKVAKPPTPKPVKKPAPKPAPKQRPHNRTGEKLIDCIAENILSALGMTAVGAATSK